jgi:hypothetical protein
MVIHKRAATCDTRLTKIEGKLVSNPLERNLGFYNFEKHTTAPNNAEQAFIAKVSKMCDKETQTELKSDCEAKDADTNINSSTAADKTTPGTNHPQQKRKKSKQNKTDEILTPEKELKTNPKASNTEAIKPIL